MRVPVRVKEDDGVGRLQVEPETSGARRKQKDEVLRVFDGEELKQSLTVLAFGGAVEAQVAELAPYTIYNQIYRLWSIIHFTLCITIQ